MKRALLLRLTIAYAVVWVLRVVFYLYNSDLLGALTWGEIPDLLRGTLIFDAANLAYTFGLFVLLSLVPFPFRYSKVYQKILYWYFVLGVVALLFFNLSDTIYFHYARKRGTIDEFSYADNDNTAWVMIKAALENWYLLLLGVAILMGAGYLYKKIKIVKPAKPRYLVNSLVFGLSVFLLITAMRGGIGRQIRPITLGNAAQFATTPLKASLVLSNPFCIFRTIGNSKIRYTKYYDATTLDSLYSPIHHHKSQTLNHKNIVIFILESFSHEHSQYLNPQLYPTQSYMPFLDSLMQHSYVFDNAYANGRKSIDALPSILASIPSFKTPFALTPQALAPMEGLGTILNKQGYESWFFNGSQERSMGFVAFAKSAGFNNIRTMESYEAARGSGDYDGYWGIWDEPFLNFMAHELSTAKQPFVAATFTLSSHHPFVVPEKYRDVLPKGKTKVHQPVAYTDLAMRRFFDYAKTEPWYENTVFVMVADHVSSETFSQQARTDKGNSHIIQFIYTPDGTLAPMHDTVTTQQIDLMPTLLALIGYDKPYFAFGRNAFRQRDRGFAVNYTGTQFQWITDSVSYYFDETTTGTARADSAVKAFIQRYYEQMERGEFLP
ncbi:putative sulfatase [Mucinivorans hirudinis]|uniref:Putative sulfatase n=1 Tax=Mucinivorans hirudinis TaxID=1433126 RepID=A0A060RDE8_9BACT|nr:putative sulfatase [Mucinivorans hirudinis]